jgi:putative Mn2+ efflux pump MntP
MTNAMVCAKRSRLILMAAFYAVFQAVMPLVGWTAGSAVLGFIDRFGGIFTGIILCAVGIAMTRTGLCRDEICPFPLSLTIKVLLAQSVATSIDAFAVGIGFRAIMTGIFPASMLIGVVTFIVCLAAAEVGLRFGNWLGKRAQLSGGLLLIALGVFSWL